MLHRLISTSAIALAFLLAFVIPSFAEDHEGPCPHACQKGRFEMSHVTGTVLCVNCFLREMAGANVDCAKAGHLWAISPTKVESYCAEDKTAASPKLIFCLQNDGAKSLGDIKLGATVTLSGKLYFAAPMLDVEEVKIMEKSE